MEKIGGIFIDKKKLNQIDDVFKLLACLVNLRLEAVLMSIVQISRLLYATTLCVVYRENSERRYYETVILEVERKNFYDGNHFIAGANNVS